MNVEPGMIIESIDGETVAADRDLAEFLNRKAGKNVLLGVAQRTVRREVVVKPITRAEENRLLYTRWVRAEPGRGGPAERRRLGYVHIPGMNDGAYRTTIEEVMGKYITKEAWWWIPASMAAATWWPTWRCSSAGKSFFDYTTDTRSTGYEPNFRWTKPSVSLANEANYSDGHCYA